MAISYCIIFSFQWYYKKWPFFLSLLFFCLILLQLFDWNSTHFMFCPLLVSAFGACSDTDKFIHLCIFLSVHSNMCGVNTEKSSCLWFFYVSIFISITKKMFFFSNEEKEKLRIFHLVCSNIVWELNECLFFWELNWSWFLWGFYVNGWMKGIGCWKV